MFICFDIGGTKTRMALTKNGKEFFKEPVTFSTPADFNEGIEKIRETVFNLIDEEKIKGVIGGIAGPLDKEHSRLVHSPNLAKWINEPLKESLERALKTRVRIENDADLAGLGEALYGAGKGKHIVAYLTISTGVGGARIVGGKIDENAIGFEPGSQVFDFDKSANPKAHSNSAQDYLSGAAFAGRFGRNAEEITDQKIWNEFTEWLYYTVNNTIIFWSPDVLVLGGGMIINNSYFNIYQMKDLGSEVKIAELGDYSALYGAMSLINLSNNQSADHA